MATIKIHEVKATVAEKGDIKMTAPTQISVKVTHNKLMLVIGFFIGVVSSEYVLKAMEYFGGS